MTDFLDEKRKEITSRLSELKPRVDEYRRLEAAASALRNRPHGGFYLLDGGWPECYARPDS